MTLKRRARLVILQSMGFLLILNIAMIPLACGGPSEQQGLDPTARIWGEIIPEEGTVTSYGISLSLENTQQFIDWYNSIELSTEEQAIRDMALSSQVAPCCDKYPMSTCCCECNLARSVWGLSAYLITEKDYGVNQVQEAASQWLHFIRPDYYVGKELEGEGIDPTLWGFTTESSCFAGNCNRPFYTEMSSSHLGGCGGMEELIQVELN
jgi:hypothetical protein